ncbi:hypothetical protein J5N97_014256 [Dioscorea zingiberensis]|uniref:Uncharacterized protein n=1 Tax=Dioscorea zingiberensis TaxID=325984 RepID=A0A9D5HJW4_9LILI|nr:hypothetical protein J5N97_014256 [Dioscorea zingiberensis]
MLFSQALLAKENNNDQFLAMVIQDCYHQALHMAAANGHVDIVEYLIQNGAWDVNASNTEKNTSSALGLPQWPSRAMNIPPMDEAVSRGKMEVVDMINAALAESEINGVGVS